MAFEPSKHTISVQGGKQYLPVAYRLVWLREEHPDWSIQTTPIEINLEQQYAIFTCIVKDGEGRIIGQGTKMENRQGFGDWLEKAETGSIGRALLVCGFGTAFAPELDEGERLADSPQQPKQQVAQPKPPTELICSECNTSISAAALQYSTRTFGIALCTACQKPHKEANNQTYTISDPESPATDKQKGMVKKLFADKGFGDVQEDKLLLREYGVPSCAKLTKGQASELIEYLKAYEPGSEPELFSDEPPVPEPGEE